MNRGVVIPVAAVALAAVAGGATWASAGRDSSSSGETSTTSRAGATATVARRDLMQHETVDGTLGYADSRTSYAQAMGTVTGLRNPGSIVDRGETLYWLDGKAVTLMYGNVPMWRRLDSRSDRGRDIRELERNLVALGYDPGRDIDVDDEWDSGTTAAVRRWQKDKGLPTTGAAELGQIAVLPGRRRIGELKTTRGALLQPGAEVFDTSSTRRVVTVDLDAEQQHLVNKGDKVEIELPGGSTVSGRISSVGKVAESVTDPATGEQSGATIPVEISLPRGARAGSLDETPVDVALVKDRAKNALTVPVSALLALSEGGYAVEVVDADGSTHLVRVEPGMYADGLVAINGSGIEKGMKVVVPK